MDQLDPNYLVGEEIIKTGWSQAYAVVAKFDALTET